MCFDVGAHIGQCTYVLARTVGAHNVHAFEPHPESYAKLQLLFPKVHLWDLAFSDRASERLLRVPYLGGQECRTRATLEARPEPGETDRAALPVQTATVDQSVAEHQIQALAFVKIDVEGHELNVVRGAQRTLSTHPPVVLIEIEQRHHDQQIEDVFGVVCQFFRSWGRTHSFCHLVKDWRSSASAPGSYRGVRF